MLARPKSAIPLAAVVALLAAPAYFGQIIIHANADAQGPVEAADLGPTAWTTSGFSSVDRGGVSIVVSDQRSQGGCLPDIRVEPTTLVIEESFGNSRSGLPEGSRPVLDPHFDWASHQPPLHWCATQERYIARAQAMGLFDPRGTCVPLGACPSNDPRSHVRVLSCAKTYLLDTESTPKRVSE